MGSGLKNYAQARAKASQACGLGTCMYMYGNNVNSLTPVDMGGQIYIRLSISYTLWG